MPGGCLEARRLHRCKAPGMQGSTGPESSLFFACEKAPQSSFFSKALPVVFEVIRCFLHSFPGAFKVIHMFSTFFNVFAIFFTCFPGLFKVIHVFFAAFLLDASCFCNSSCVLLLFRARKSSSGPRLQWFFNVFHV